MMDLCGAWMNMFARSSATQEEWDSSVLDDTEIYEWDMDIQSEDEDLELLALADQESVTMATSLSSSMAEEFVICSKCHHPIETSRSIDWSRFTDRASTPCPGTHIYTSTPYTRNINQSGRRNNPGPKRLNESDLELPSRLDQSHNSTCELPRDADQSYLGNNNMTPDPDSFVPESRQRTGLKDYNMTLGQCSFLELPASRLAEITDLELSEEFLPGYLCEVPLSTSLALCQSCSLYSPHTPSKDLHGSVYGPLTPGLASNRHPGSRMSMYFPDKTGVDPSNQRSRRDSLCCSVSSEDSGACDVDDVLSHECSMHEQASHIDQSSCSMAEVSARLQESLSHDCNNNVTNSSSFEVIPTPTKQAKPANKPEKTPTKLSNISTSMIAEITSALDRHHDDVEQLHTETDEKFAAAGRHLEARREYYHEAVEQWYWKQLVTLQRTQGEVKRDQEERAESTRQVMADLRECVHRLEKPQHKQLNHISHSVDLQAGVHRLEELVRSLQESVRGHTEVTFTVGRCERLTSDHLGGVLVQRRPTAETVPRLLLPGRCLHAFDSRQGASSDYLATGLSLTTHGDLIVTDTGMDCVNVFTASGEHKMNINTIPGDYPTTATNFNDLIAVACNDKINLYDMVQGSYHSIQLPQSLTRPQGVTTDADGHLVVSAQCIDIPAVAVYDRDSLLQRDFVIGDTKCTSATEDITGSELIHSTNHVLFSKPWYLAVNQSDQFLVSDRDDHIVKVISRSGELVSQFGGLGHRPGQFFQPAGLCVDPHGRIIVADSQNHRVQVLTPGDDQVVCVATLEHDGIECPMDVALDRLGRLYVLQGDGMVRVYQYC